MPVIFDVLIATGITVASLAMVAYNAPSEQFLKWACPTALGLGAMLGVSLLSVLYPNSRSLQSL